MSLYYVLGSRKEVEVKLIEDDGASVHIEEHDKEGRELFKAKKHTKTARTIVQNRKFYFSL